MTIVIVAQAYVGDDWVRFVCSIKEDVEWNRYNIKIQHLIFNNNRGKISYIPMGGYKVSVLREDVTKDELYDFLDSYVGSLDEVKEYQQLYIQNTTLEVIDGTGNRHSVQDFVKYFTSSRLAIDLSTHRTNSRQDNARQMAERN